MAPPRDQLYERCGRGDRARQQEVMRQYVEEPIREGMVESPWDRLVAGVILGSKEFVKKVKGGVKGNRREQKAIRRIEGRVSWEEIVQAVEGVRQGKWKEFRDQHGDWGRDAALYLGRHQGRMKLRELAEVAGGIHYAVVGAAVSRFGRRLKQGQLESEMKQIQSQLSKSEM